LKKILLFLRNPRLWAIVLTVVVFFCFFSFLIEQNKNVYMYHDDYGYATLSYVYFEPNIVGQTFNASQLVDYLEHHYTMWGGRVLSFAQEILLFKAGTDTMRVVQAIVIGLIFLIIFQLSRKNSRGKPYLIALFACALYGFFSEGTATSGLYWYSASIAYLFPVLYLMAGGYVFYKIMFDDSGKFYTVQKFLMLPGAIVLFFLAGFSMEQIGVAAVACAAVITVGAFWKYKKLWLAVYSAPVLAAVMWGCNIMLVAPGNIARRNSSLYTAYYALPFKWQVITSARNIVDTIFSPANLLFAVLIFICAGAIAYIVLKNIKNPFSKFINGLTMGFSAVLLGCALLPSLNAICFKNDTLRSAFLWLYVCLVTVSVSQWLLSQKKPADKLIWYLFIAGLVSQGSALISPVYFDRCTIVFDIIWFLIAARLFAYLLDKIALQDNSKHSAAVKIAWILVPVLVLSLFNLAPIYMGYRQNAPVNEYNNEMMQLASEKNKLGIEVFDLQLMKMPNSTYTQTQPYDRALIMDWMKIYYNIPKDVNFVYSDYDQAKFKTMQENLVAEQKTMSLRH